MGFPQRDQEVYSLAWSFPVVEGETQLRTGSAEGYQRFVSPLWKVQSDCTVTLKLVFQVVSYNFGAGEGERGSPVIHASLKLALQPRRALSSCSPLLHFASAGITGLHPVYGVLGIEPSMPALYPRHCSPSSRVFFYMTPGLLALDSWSYLKRPRQ